MTTNQLGHVDLAILEFERLTWAHPGAKDAEIHARFALSPTRYAARLARILANPAATAYDPATVNRLRRVAARRAEVRTRGTAAAGVSTVVDTRGVRPAVGGLR